MGFTSGVDPAGAVRLGPERVLGERPSAFAARVGGALLIIGGPPFGLVLIASAATGRFDPETVGPLAQIALPLLAVGMLLASSGGIPPFAKRPIRAGFGLLGVGLASGAVSLLVPDGRVWPSIGEAIWLVLATVAFLGTTIGSGLTVLGLVAAPGPCRLAGFVFVGCLALASVAAILSSLAALIAAGALVVVGLVLVGTVGLTWDTWTDG